VLGKPLLSYGGMPRAAQFFPTPDQFGDDKGTELRVYQCTDCGLVQVAGVPVPYYREVIRAAGFSEEMLQFRRMQFGRWVQSYGLGNKRLLEVGCGRGEYLALLRDAGIAAHGLEYSSSAVSACQAAELSVSRGFLASSDQVLSAGPFDAFACFNFLEHWPEPVETLRAIRANLNDGGLGFVEVPNFDMILKEGLYSEFIRDHLSYFTSQTLAHTLQRSGFDVLQCESVWYDYILSAVVRKRNALDVTLLNDRKECVDRALVAFLDRYPEKSVAVWGAGHQALATISLAAIGHRIACVIDSAPFKQGRFTPVDHIPIVAPESLPGKLPKAIIVMAGGYSDEVCRIIRQDFGQSIEIAVLRNSGLEAFDGQ
jgi:2-polyprenyl-3-methyl-5-hydroxy-6-metoxy-1,4-benzoquinol methylase